MGNLSVELNGNDLATLGIEMSLAELPMLQGNIPHSQHASRRRCPPVGPSSRGGQRQYLQAGPDDQYSERKWRDDKAHNNNFLLNNGDRVFVGDNRHDSYSLTVGGDGGVGRRTSGETVGSRGAS